MQSLYQKVKEVMAAKVRSLGDQRDAIAAQAEELLADMDDVVASARVAEKAAEAFIDKHTGG